MAPKKSATKTALATSATTSTSSHAKPNSKGSPVRKIIMKKDGKKQNNNKPNQFQVCLIACTTDGNDISFEGPSKMCIVFVFNPGKDATYASGFSYFADCDIEAGLFEDNRFVGPFVLCEESDPNRALLDQKNFFCRGIIVQGDPEEDDTVQYRRLICEKYMKLNQDHPRNIFNEYVVLDDFDKTPVGELQPLNKYITNKDVVRFIKMKYGVPMEECDATWARSHSLESKNYFKGPMFPQIAIQELGYTNITE